LLRPPSSALPEGRTRADLLRPSHSHSKTDLEPSRDIDGCLYVGPMPGNLPPSTAECRIETTLNAYMHAIPDSQRRAVDRVAGVLFPDVPKFAPGSQEPR